MICFVQCRKELKIFCLILQCCCFSLLVCFTFESSVLLTTFLTDSTPAYYINSAGIDSDDYSEQISSGIVSGGRRVVEKPRNVSAGKAR